MIFPNILNKNCLMLLFQKDDNLRGLLKMFGTPLLKQTCQKNWECQKKVHQVVFPEEHLPELPQDLPYLLLGVLLLKAVL